MTALPVPYASAPEEYQSSTRSFTFPLRSHNPHAFAASVVELELPAYLATPPMVFDPEHVVSSPARAAYSHSASVGRR